MEVIRVRIRTKKDEDLKVVLDNLPKHIDKSHLIRTALRYYLFERQDQLQQVDRIPVVLDDLFEDFALNPKEVDIEEIEKKFDNFLDNL
ncbi:hypothetical protein GCM10023310_68720 [Paenibacillus vulneris]|uniref:Ribbon-helix-helix protein CopG domain-containing protein n=1 Tax=Paenibacillus vulneris TaxID=1133364 RepID=A0ABW3UFE8_9BACL